MTGDRTAISDGHRCRWHAPGGRCPGPRAFPGERMPPFCIRHLAELEPWVAARATLRSAEAPQWIEWARRKAADMQTIRQMLG